MNMRRYYFSNWGIFSHPLRNSQRIQMPCCFGSRYWGL